MTSRGTSLGDPTVLLGTWQLSRLIDDRLSGERSSVEGALSLTQVSPGRLRWQEQGRWHRPDGDLDVRRGLWLVGDAVSTAWWVRFEDDRDFHPWAPGSAVTHACGADSYRGLVLGTSERWTVEWDVIGPAKDYAMATELTRPQ